MVAQFEAATFGFLAGVVLIGMISRWVYAIVITLQKYRGTTVPPHRPLVWALPVVTLLHSGPWALGLAVYLSYFVLSRPHAAWWVWFYGGSGGSLIFMATAILYAWRRGKAREGNYVEKPGVSSSPTKEEASDERSRRLMHRALWASVPVIAMAVAAMWDFILKEPEFAIVIVVVIYLATYAFGTLMDKIVHPAPWRSPPSRKR